MTIETFGRTADGREVLSFTLGNASSYVRILDLGGALQSIVVPDASGKPTDVLLGYPDVEGYERNGGYLGALIGRFGNRIGEGKLFIDGTLYELYNNDRGNHLHGGKCGFDKKIWEHEVKGERLILSLVSPDGEENYPGTLRVTVEYTFSDGRLGIRYRAVSDKKTAVNLTNHAYFNLSGEADGSILDTVLRIDSDCITPTTPTMIPVGGFRAVEGTPFDFTRPKPIGKEIDADDADLRQGNGYDHCFVLRGSGKLAQCAEASSPKTGIKMRCYTDQPAVQFYAGNGLRQQGKGGYYGKRAGFCLETQAIPNNVNVPAYARLGSSVIAAGKPYETETVYEFSAE